ncbi:fibrinogen-like protein 1-like protein [Carcharodon carcharias]|uniref:fibrinogen-like protein 1-like protein n=1 Tax=Carcharodon carcharias TaxID=13397 RepID=UPI001B7E65F3|nr:fibrinogen-like protein 1-like protein [Carcharodon carcharias]
MMKMEQGALFQIGFFLLLTVATISALPRDCTEIRHKSKNATSGLYVIQPVRSPPLVVNCVMNRNGGWTVIQRNRRSSKITWRESWTTYKYGFGDVMSDHWLGNEYIYLLTKQNRYKLRIEFRDYRNTFKYAEYSSFYLEPESGKYTIRLGPFTGNVPDQLTRLTKTAMIDNQAFTTRDRDNDNYRSCCAVRYGGWWFDACGYAYLNNKNPYWSGISILKVTMMIQATC